MSEQLDYTKSEQKQMSDDLALKENELEVCLVILQINFSWQIGNVYLLSLWLTDLKVCQQQM